MEPQTPMARGGHTHEQDHLHSGHVCAAPAHVQAYGAGAYLRLGVILQRALLVCWTLCVPVVLLWSQVGARAQRVWAAQRMWASSSNRTASLNACASRGRGHRWSCCLHVRVFVRLLAVARAAAAAGAAAGDRCARQPLPGAVHPVLVPHHDD